jgi:cytochrome c
VQGLGHCGACHTPRGLGFQERGYDESSPTYLTGSVNDNWFAPNLTGDPDSGLGRIGENDLAAFLKTGHGAGLAAFGPMVEQVEDSTQYLTDDDARAMAHYLKSLTPQSRPDATIRTRSRICPRATAIASTNHNRSVRGSMSHSVRNATAWKARASPTCFRDLRAIRP